MIYQEKLPYEPAKKHFPDFDFCYRSLLYGFPPRLGQLRSNKVLDYTGVVQESTYENPHATARIKDKNKIWVVVLAPTTRMDARGLNAEMLAKGATIRVVGYPHKKIKDEMRAERIFIDGKKFELR